MLLDLGWHFESGDEIGKARNVSGWVRLAEHVGTDGNTRIDPAHAIQPVVLADFNPPASAGRRE